MEQNLNPNTTVVEAASFSGKTTILNQSRERVRTIQEYAAYADGGRSFAQIPFESQEVAVECTKFFVNIEKNRGRKAIKLSNEATREFIAMDRNLLGCLALRYAIREMYPDEPNGYIGALDIVERAYNEEPLVIIPSSITYIKPPTEEQFIARITERGRTGVPILDNPHSGQVMQNWYLECVNTCFSPENSLVLESNHGNIQANADQFIDFLEQQDRSKQLEYQQKFLNNISHLRNI